MLITTNNGKRMISVIICTLNRAELLCECINSLMEQSVSRSRYEILVIDNASTDDTSKKIQQFYPWIHYFYEAKTGLSNARNRGFAEAKSEWVTYLDDDAIAHHNFIEKILWTTETYHWDCFGGVFNRWFKYGQPAWYPEKFGTNKYDFERIDVLPDDKFACGGVMTIRKSILEKFGGFNPQYGMSGNFLGYGEEIELQKRIRESGYIIGFNPEIQIDHLVAKYKLSVWWHLRAAWINEQSGAKFLGRSHYPFTKTLFSIFRALYKQLKYLRNIKSKNYYWQNLIFDYSEPIIRRTSALYTLYIKNSDHK
jgi:GT2 family glycosyltransferase